MQNGRVICALALAPIASMLGGCWERCGPPAEPLIDFVVTLERTPDSNDYMHIAMFNPSDEWVDALSEPAKSRWAWTLGNCDGNPQRSGAFKLVACLNPPTGSEWRWMCQGPKILKRWTWSTSNADDGCFPARAARITIR